MKRLLSIVVLFLTAAICFAQNIEIKCSQKNQSHTIHEHTYFKLCFTENNTPEYVIWSLTKKQVELAQSNNERKNNFRPCELGSADLLDYKKSGFDRGHMCPYADMDFNETAGDETFLMCNMCPQVHSFNAGSWLELEKLDRLYAKMKGSITIAAGPIYEDNLYIGSKNRVRVPTAFWRVFFDPKTNFIECYIAYAGNDKVEKVDYKAIERVTGLKFSFKRSLTKTTELKKSDVAPATEKSAKSVATAASRASDAKADLDWDE